APGCRRPRPPPPDTAPLAVAFAGCAAVVRAEDSAPICEGGEPRTLRLVLPDGASEITVATNGALLAPRGRRPSTLAAPSPRGASVFEVSARMSGQPARFQLRLAEAREPAWLTDAKAKRARGDGEGAGAIAAAHLGVTDPLERALA